MTRIAAASLQELFGRHGDVGRLVLPPTRVLALVEYLEASAARSAFRALAYRRLQHVPLYLEWAPAGIFAGPAMATTSAQVRPNLQAHATYNTCGASQHAPLAAYMVNLTFITYMNQKQVYFDTTFYHMYKNILLGLL